MKPPPHATAHGKGQGAGGGKKRLGRNGRGLRPRTPFSLPPASAVRNGAFTVPGDGDVDFDPVFRVLADAHYQGWLLVEAEQDPAKADPLEYAIKGRRYIREHTGL